MIFLGLVICVAGIAAALLPAIPEGTMYWALLLGLSILYPLILARTFKSNRADYEFRVLHWFPACIFMLWFVLQLLSPRFDIIRIFALGFFYLWSLPLVALGIAFMSIFALHVLRRSRLRVTTLVVFFSLFTIGALYAESANLNPRLQAMVFPDKPQLFASVRASLVRLRASLGMQSDVSVLQIARSESSSSSRIASSFRSRNVVAVTSSLSSSMSRSAVASLPPVIADKNPGHLTKSGPEDIAVLGLTLLAGYAAVLHARAKKRV